MRQTSALLLVAFALLVLACAGAAGPRPRPREELKALLLGKTKQEVREVLGRPDSTSEDFGSGDGWRYDSISFDPETGKVDYFVRIYFGADRKTRVDDVRFGSP